MQVPERQRVAIYEFLFMLNCIYGVKKAFNVNLENNRIR